MVEMFTTFGEQFWQAAAAGPQHVLWLLFVKGGWFLILVMLWPIFKDIWLDWRQNKWAAGIDWVYLAIDVPRNNEQSPKAVEQIFNQIWGYLSGPNLWKKWIGGEFVLSMSLEIVSIGGYIQYIIRCPRIFRDLVEAAVYAQYTEADISEIEDYTKDFTPQNFKEKGWNLWGAQYQFTAKSDYYPIRTYPLFEHSISQKIIDPMSAMLEMMAKLGPNEQLWFQIVIKPAPDPDWKPKADKLVKKLIGIEEKTKKGYLDKFLENIYTTFGFMFPGFKPEKSVQSEYPSNVLYMSKGDLETVHAIEIKSSKTGFYTKMRMIYLGSKGDFHKPRGVSPFNGALKQYSSLNANGFKPAKKTATSSDYIGAKKRIYKKQKKILRAFKSRSMYLGVNPNGYIMNVEELASLYHFPTIEVGTKSVKSSESKKSPAPMDVPVDLSGVMEDNQPEIGSSYGSSNHKNDASIPPPNLPM